MSETSFPANMFTFGSPLTTSSLEKNEPIRKEVNSKEVSK